MVRPDLGTFDLGVICLGNTQTERIESNIIRFQREFKILYEKRLFFPMSFS